MDKYFCSLLIVFLFTSPLKSQKTILLSDGMVIDGLLDSTPTFHIEEEESGITITYDFHCLILLSDSLYPSTVIPRIKGFGFSQTVGKPNVPVRWDAISLPFNTFGQVSIIDSVFIDIPVELSPARGIRFCGDDDYNLLNVPPVASYLGFYPSSILPSFEQYHYRKTPIMNVCVCPVEYNYGTRTARIFSRIKIPGNLD